MITCEIKFNKDFDGYKKNDILKIELNSFWRNRIKDKDVEIIEDNKKKDKDVEIIEDNKKKDNVYISKNECKKDKFNKKENDNHFNNKKGE